MLSQSFLEWWFTPWEYAAAEPALFANADDLARRDAYRLWCESEGVTAELPVSFDAGWCVAASRNAQGVLYSARLFAGLIAARNRDAVCLDLLPLADRRWCLAIAATQPLRSLSGIYVQSEGQLQACGLLELSLRLEDGFPGLWSRMRLMLPMYLRSEVDAHAGSGQRVRHPDTWRDMRSQRIWQICMARAAATLDETGNVFRER